LDSFSVELATGTCPQCTSALEWAFSEPAPAPAARVVEITDDIPLTRSGEAALTPSDTSSSPAPETVLGSETHKSVEEPETHLGDLPSPPRRHTLRLVFLLLLLAGLVFTHMVLTSDPERAWGVFVKFFDQQETPAQIQAHELREARERQKPPPAKTAGNAPETTSENTAKASP